MSTCLLDAGYQVLALDISAAMLDQAEALHHLFARHGFQGYVVADAQEMPFGEGQFDVAVCLRLMGYLSDPSKRDVSREFRRVSSTGAVVMFIKDSILLRARRAVQLAMGRDARPADWLPSSRSELDHICSDAGWTVIRRTAVFPVLSESECWVLRPSGAPGHDPLA